MTDHVLVLVSANLAPSRKRDNDAAVELVKRAYPNVEVVRLSRNEADLRAEVQDSKTNLNIWAIDISWRSQRIEDAKFACDPTPDACVTKQVWLKLREGPVRCRENASYEEATIAYTMSPVEIPRWLNILDLKVRGEFLTTEAEAVWEWMEVTEPADWIDREALADRGGERIWAGPIRIGSAILKARKQWEDEVTASCRASDRFRELEAERASLIEECCQGAEMETLGNHVWWTAEPDGGPCREFTDPIPVAYAPPSLAEAVARELAVGRCPHFAGPGQAFCTDTSGNCAGCYGAGVASEPPPFAVACSPMHDSTGRQVWRYVLVAAKCARCGGSGEMAGRSTRVGPTREHCSGCWDQGKGVSTGVRVNVLEVGNPYGAIGTPEMAVFEVAR